MTQMDFILVFDVIILLLGIYIIFSGIKMNMEKTVPTLFLSRDEVSRCRDTEGMVKFLFPRTLIFGGISALFGVQGLYNDVTGAMSDWVNLVMMLIFLAAWVWFSMALRKGKETYL